MTDASDNAASWRGLRSAGLSRVAAQGRTLRPSRPIAGPRWYAGRGTSTTIVAGMPARLGLEQLNGIMRPRGNNRARHSPAQLNRIGARTCRAPRNVRVRPSTLAALARPLAALGRACLNAPRNHPHNRAYGAAAFGGRAARLGASSSDRGPDSGHARSSPKRAARRIASCRR